MRFGGGQVQTIARRESYMNRNILAATALIAMAWFPEPSGAQVASAMEDYERVQKMRSEADRQAKEGGTEGLQRARETLMRALEHLDRAEVREKAEGNRFLYARRHDVNLDLAQL